MISESQLKRYCRGDFTKVENYDAAMADTRKWECHHRLELTEDGDFQYSKEDLKKKGWYYNRPPSELIFLIESEHKKLHAKGSNHPMYGKVHSDTTREKIGTSSSKANKGRHWYNNGLENKRAYDCPEGFVKGRLLKRNHSSPNK